MAEIRRAGFVDERGVLWDPNDADLVGVLFKESKWIKEWRQRHCLLKGSKLFFFTTDEETPSKPAHGMIDLVDCISCQKFDCASSGGGQTTKREHIIEIVLFCQRPVYLAAESQGEQEQWVQAVQSCVEKTLHSFVE